VCVLFPEHHQSSRRRLQERGEGSSPCWWSIFVGGPSLRERWLGVKMERVDRKEKVKQWRVQTKVRRLKEEEEEVWKYMLVFISLIKNQGNRKWCNNHSLHYSGVVIVTIKEALLSSLMMGCGGGLTSTVKHRTTTVTAGEHTVCTTGKPDRKWCHDHHFQVIVSDDTFPGVGVQKKWKYAGFAANGIKHGTPPVFLINTLTSWLFFFMI